MLVKLRVMVTRDREMLTLQYNMRPRLKKLAREMVLILLKKLVAIPMMSILLFNLIYLIQECGMHLIFVL